MLCYAIVYNITFVRAGIPGGHDHGDTLQDQVLHGVVHGGAEGAADRHGDDAPAARVDVLAHPLDASHGDFVRLAETRLTQNTLLYSLQITQLTCI